ncbi:uncharacterized protein G2W53_019334 [Senna tora]|uniref:Uncharacterized protein n=1 Tax=Senna tora TaxID=362788 RepID=A0A834WLX2_9FABA|nr:uncharacterized protein G2W53_019334 [Senna tora]
MEEAEEGKGHGTWQYAKSSILAALS